MGSEKLLYLRKLYFWRVLGFELVLLVGSEISMYFWWGLCTSGGVLFFSNLLLVGSKNIVLLVGSHRTFGGFELFSVL